MTVAEYGMYDSEIKSTRAIWILALSIANLMLYLVVHIYFLDLGTNL